MSEVKELKIVAFLCNWCSYGGADSAGVGRFTQPTDMRIVRVPCSGRVNPLFVLKALLDGADGVLVSGCHPKDCHYTSGNYYARRRLESLKEFISILGIDSRRFSYSWVSASEGQKWKEVVTEFTNSIHALGPAPKFRDATPMYDLPTNLYDMVRPLACGANPFVDELKTKAKEALANGLEGILGWRKGPETLLAEPFFAKTPEQIDEFVWGPTNVQSLVGLLHKHKGKKVGIVVKGCDSRAIVALLQEKLLNKDDITIIGMQCNGTIDRERVLAKVKELSGIRKPVVTSFVGDAKGMTVTVKTAEGDKEFTVASQDIMQDKCRQCTMPAAKFFDVFVGAEGQPLEADTRAPIGLAFLNEMSLEGRMSFWRGHIERCMHCYACRNSCPMCVCKDYCAGDSRDPHWVADDNTPESKMFFQLIHAQHLAGRCTGCAECSRACPMGIPVFWLKQQFGGIMKRVFGYTAGIDINSTPPLLGYQVEEENIKDHF